MNKENKNIQVIEETPKPESKKLNKNEGTKDMRKIMINSNQIKRFPNNQIKTAKYNPFTFLPLATIYQFNNYFNVFFLITAVISSITLISPLDPATALGPFILVLSVSLIREAIEDWKKTKFDTLYNNSLSITWNYSTKKFEDIKWKDIQVGNIIKVCKNEIIPCDVLVLKTSAENGFCYLETTNLDGESALKPRESTIITNTMIINDQDINNIHGFLEVDQPNNDIYTVDGTLFLDNYERSYFDINNVLVRGGRLKNVEYVFGIVIYTGKDTKIMKNIKNGSLKLSSIDTKLNYVVIYILLIVLILCVVSTVFGAFFRGDNIPDYAQGLLKADYLLYYDTGKDSTLNSNDILEVVRIFAADFIIFNTLIPISLMISYQVIKGFQIVLIEQDPSLAEEPEDKVKMLSMALHEDLGTVKYIFSDKTGTLTRNEMEFKACSIFTKVFDDEEENEEANLNNYKNTTEMSLSNYISVTNKINMLSSDKKSSFAKTFDKNTIINALNQDIPLEIFDLSSCPFRSYREAMLECFINIAINHNVLTEVDSNTGQKTYQGSNPDEVTLVSSAAELGIEFVDRQNRFIRIKILGHEQTYEILHKFDFSSARMRSSIVVRDPFGIPKLYMKGADSIILQKINNFSKTNIKDKCKEHLDSFAKRGLRTLCYSMKFLNEDELTAWEENYKEIKYQAINDKSLANKVEESISSLESDLILIGVTALEDKLQDNVKNDLQEFIEAGINVWMITGDKLDTAETIGHSCKLFNDDTEVFKIKSASRQQVIDRMKEILEKMKNLEKELEELKKRGLQKNDKQKKTSENKKEENNEGNYTNKNNEIFSKNKNDQNALNGNARSKFHNLLIFNSKDKPNEEINKVKEFKDLNEFIFGNDQNKKEISLNINNKSHVTNNSQSNNSDIVKYKSKNHNTKIKKDSLTERASVGNYKNPSSNSIEKNKNWMRTIKLRKNKLSSLNIEKYENDFYSHNQLEINKSSPEINLDDNRNNRKKISNLSEFAKERGSEINLNSCKSSYPISPTKKLEEDINDVSIMNLLMDRNYFEQSSNDQFNNFTFWNKIVNKKSMNNISNNMKSDNNPALENNVVVEVDEIDKINNDNVQEDANPFKYITNENNVNNFSYKEVGTNDNQNNAENIPNSNIIKKQPVPKNSLASEIIQHLDKNIVVINDIKEVIVPSNNKEKTGEGIMINKSSMFNKKELKIDVIINEDVNNIRRKTSKMHTTQGLGNKLLKVENFAFHTYTPNVLNADNKQNNTSFKNIFDYYQEQIDRLERRKKGIIPVFDFTPKKKKETNEITQEEDEFFSKNYYLMNFGIIIEGASISHCLDPEASSLFWRLMKKSRSVVACRCSPLQKAEIVNFVKNKSGEITLAIGDGGNDVNMIKTANVGVGLFGKEGYQAAYSADYAISQFKYLKKLIFNHGRFSLERNSYFVYFFFFKNVMFTLPQFWMCFFSGFSGVNYYDDWYYLGFNSFLTALPIGALAIMDEDLDIDFIGYPNREILKFLIPDIYKEYRDSIPFNVGKFFFVFFAAFLYSLANYFVPFFSFKYGIQDDAGRAFTFWDHSLSSFLSILIIHFVVICVDTNLCTLFNTVVYILQIIIIIIFVFIHNARNSGQESGITFDILNNLIFWFTTFMTCIISLLPFFISRRADYHFSENIINNLRQKKYEKDYAKKVYVKKLEQMTKATRSIAKFKRIYKQENAETDNYADKRMKEMVEMYKMNKIKQKEIDKIERENIKFNKNLNAKSMKRSKSDLNLIRKSKNINNNFDINDNVGMYISNNTVDRNFLERREIINGLNNDGEIEHNIIKNINEFDQILETSSSNSQLSENKNIEAINRLETNPSKFYNWQ